MKKHLPCYYISRPDYEQIRKGLRSPNIQRPPSLVIEPIERYNAESIRGLAISSKTKEYHTPFGITDYSYFRDYEQHDAGVFTFDGVTFYKILGYNFTTDEKVEINLQRIREPYEYRPNTGFMLMPFKAPSLKDFYEVHIKNFLKSEMNFEILRADDFCDDDVIIDTIFSQIENAEFIIAEISECNKSVFYELGYAAAKQKNIITILQSGKESSFFDRSHIRWIEYSFDNPEAFKKKLIDTIKNIRNKRGSIE